MLIFKEVIDFKVNSRDLTLFIILAIIGGLFFNYMDYNYAMLPFFVYSARNVNTTTIVKISYRISLVLLIFIIVSSYLGWITNYITYDGGREREYVGFRYSLFGPAILCNIIFLKVYLEKDNIKWRTLMFLIIGNYALYEFTDSRLTFGLGMLLLILTILIKLFSKFKRVLMNKILIGSYVVSGLLSLYFTIGYNHLSEWHSNINEFLGGRLSLGYSTLKYYGYGLLGKRITLVGNGLDVDGYITTETYDYVEGRPCAPKGEKFEEAVADWKTLVSDPDAEYDKVITIDVSELAPMVTWGTNPEMGVEFDQPFPEIKDFNDERAYEYMDVKPGEYAKDIDLGYVFIGSCTNARLSDLELAAKFVKGKHIAPTLTAIVVPGSRPVKKEAERLGLDKIFLDAGFEWRDPGCSMCLGMNPDHVPEGVHCASTSNRNFEGRQGYGARTHLCSPAMAAAAAIAGKFVDVRYMPEVQA